MFHNISDSLNKVFSKIAGKKFISEDDINLAMREIRIALLEADVSLSVVRDFIDRVKEKAMGEAVIKNVSPAQMIVKIVNDELIELLGREKAEINLAVKPPVIIMMVGLQGSGKTTSAAKLALRLKDKHHKKPLLVSLDTERPAAQEQLAILAKQAGIDSLEIIAGQKPLDIAKRAMNKVKEGYYDIIVFDTAGRLHIDDNLMLELEKIKEMTNPHETLLVADSLTGQDAVNIAQAFNEHVPLTGIILTRIDGDGRGGAAISMKMVTGCPIKYIGVGEGIREFEEFYPERIASRILGMGDVVSLVEKAQEVVDEEEAKKLEKKLQKGTFDFEDLLKQFKNMKKMGGLSSLLGFLPGAGAILDQIDQMGGVNEKDINKQEALILSMTLTERRKPDMLNSSRKRRIAEGAGQTIQDVNRLLKKYKQMQKMMGKIGKVDKNKLKEMMERGDFNEGLK